MNRLQSSFITHWNHPTPGVCFFNMREFLKNVELRKFTFDLLAAKISCKDGIFLGIDSRGYILATALADRLNFPQGMIAKKGKLAGEKISTDYITEYSSSQLELEIETVKNDVIICDDILATGGSVMAAAELVIKTGGQVILFVFIAKVAGLNGEEKLKEKYPNAEIIYAATLFASPDPNPSRTQYLMTCEKVEFSTSEQIKNADYLLISHPSMYSWARQILKLYPKIFALLNVDWKRFADKKPNVQFPYKAYKKRRIIFIMSSYDNETLFEQMAFMRSITHHETSEVFYWLPYFATGTHERAQTPGVLATAQSLMELLSVKINGRLIVGDIHANGTRFYIKDATFGNVEPLPFIFKLLDKTNMTIIIPDDGALKRSKEILKNCTLPVLVFNKNRNGDGRDVSFDLGKSMNIPDKNIDPIKFEKMFYHGVMLDDIFMSGGTAEEIKKDCFKMGFKYISGYFTHMPCPKDSYNRYPQYIEGSKSFHTIYCMDSIPDIIKKLTSPYLSLPFSPSFVLDRLEGEEHKNNRVSVLINLNSTSPVKKAAVVDAANILFNYHNVKFEDIAGKSGIKNQPSSEEEVFIGLKNRHSTTNIKTLVGDYDIIFNISIENTVIEIDEKWYDIPYIMITRIDKYGESIIIEKGDKTLVPIEYIEASKTTDWNMEVGRIIAKKYGIESTDWNIKYGAKTRQQILKESLVSILGMKF